MPIIKLFGTSNGVKAKNSVMSKYADKARTLC